MYLDEWASQFFMIQPFGIMCKGCEQTYVIIKGVQQGDQLEMPRLCAYCGRELDMPVYDKGALN